MDDFTLSNDADDAPELYASIRGVAHFTAQVLLDLAKEIGLSSTETRSFTVAGGLLGAKRWQELIDSAKDNPQYSSAAYVLYDGEELDDDFYSETGMEEE